METTYRTTEELMAEALEKNPTLSIAKQKILLGYLERSEREAAREEVPTNNNYHDDI